MEKVVVSVSGDEPVGLAFKHLYIEVQKAIAANMGVVIAHVKRTNPESREMGAAMVRGIVSQVLVRSVMEYARYSGGNNAEVVMRETLRCAVDAELRSEELANAAKNAAKANSEAIN